MTGATAYLILAGTIFVLGLSLNALGLVLIRSAKLASDRSARLALPQSKLIELEGNFASLQSEFTRFQRREDQRYIRDSKKLEIAAAAAGTPGGAHIPGVGDSGVVGGAHADLFERG